MMQRQNHAIKICAKNRCVFRKREMHRFLFLKKAIEELCSKTGEADWLCFLLSASSAQEYRGMQSLCAGYRGAAPCWGQGAKPIGGLRAASPIGSRVKRLAQGELLPCDNSYWVVPAAKFAGLAASPLLPFGAISQRLEGKELKLTRHNGRAGKNGTYNPKHNDRRFDVEHSEHINPEMTKKNVYWDCYTGIKSVAFRENPDVKDFSFEEVEKLYYVEHYGDYVDAQNARNEKARHTERNRTVEDLLKNKKTCPEETIYQMGTMDEHASAEDLLKVVMEFCQEFEERFGSHVHILDWALHMDEGTPHIQERHVFDAKNQYGELCPQQEKALEELGIPLPHPDKPKGKHNNRKQTFDAICRELLFEISEKHGLHFEREPSYGGRSYLEKQDYILMKQKEKLIQQEQKLEELTLKIEDVDSLIDEVSGVAYDKAVELVTDEVKTMTHQEDIDMIEDTKVWLQSPERKAPKKERDYAVARLDGVVRRIRKAMQSTLEKMKAALLYADKKKAVTEEIKKQTKPSIVEALRRGMEEQRKKDSEKQAQEKQKKQDMEL